MEKILIVEDENIVAKDIEHSLEGLGYQIPAIASCGEEAIEKVRENAPDLILMDIMLKGKMDGVEAVQEVRRIMDVPVVYLTACADQKTLERAKATEPFGYILKPFEERELQTAVEMAIFRHRMERQLKENKEWFAATLHCIGHGVIVTDSFGKVTLLNPIAELLTGWSQEQAMGRELSSLFQLTDEITREPVPNVLETGFGGRSAFLTAKDGREIPVVIKVTPNHEGPRISGFVVSFLDISDRKRLEQLKDEFVSTVSHELRTPMMIIRESISQVLDGIHGETNEKQKNFLSLSLRGIDRLGRIVNDLLDMSKIEAGELEFKRELTDFKRLVKEVAAGFSIPAKNKGIEIREMLPKGRVWVYADKDKMTQVLTNLIGNSLKFTSQGSIEIAVSEEDSFIQCRIADTGKGVSRENLAKVFDKFQQFDRQPGPGEKGTGLGLAICKGIIEFHHGRIGVESEYGRGTVFHFRFPKSSAADVLRESVKLGVKDSVKQKIPLSILFFHLSNAPGANASARQRKKIFLISRLEKLVKQGLRRKSDLVLKENDNIFVLLHSTPEQGGRPVMQRLQEMMSLYLESHGAAEMVQLNAEMLTFNPLTATPDEFLHNFTAALGLITQKTKNQKSGKRILVVDDESDTLQLVSARLAANGYSILQASDGEGGFKMAKEEKPDLIILDWMLPGADGIEVCKRLKTDAALRKIPVILFTAKAQKMYEEFAMQAGANDYVTKPVEPKMFLEKIQKLISPEKN